MIGNNIKTLRKVKGCTQDELATALGITYQSISKWENGTSQPDISLLPDIARYFGVSIDELFGYQLDSLTNRERFVQFMLKNNIIVQNETAWYLNTENFSTNIQIAKIGEFFADCIRENDFKFDTLIGLSYHGAAFAAATAVSLANKYRHTVNFCTTRLTPDSRGRMLCGYTPQDGEHILIIDDIISSGKSVINKFEELRKTANISLEAVMVIADRSNGAAGNILSEKYGTKVYSIISEKHITKNI